MIAFAAVYVIWGSTYLTIHIAIETIPALLMSCARFVLAGLLLLAFSRRPGAPRERLTLIHWRSALIIGACLLLFGNGGVAWGEQYLPSGFVALIIATVPLWMALFAPAFGGRWINWTAAIGIAIGLAGIVLLVRPGGERSRPLADARGAARAGPLGARLALRPQAHRRRRSRSPPSRWR